MQVKHVMHTNVTCVSPAASVDEIARKMRDEDIGAIPVGHDNHLIGIVMDRDLARRGLADRQDVRDRCAMILGASFGRSLPQEHDRHNGRKCWRPVA